jgi:anti-anti-sigma regulatory factor
MTIDLHGHPDPLSVSGDRPRGAQRPASGGKSEDGRLVLSESVTIRTIEGVRDALLETTQLHRTVEIDCAAVAEADLSLVQLLLAARKSALKSGGTIVLARPASGALRDVLTRAGILAASGDPPKAEDAFWLQGARAT